MMKKTLIAVAALAATSAFAQVTITGGYAFGLKTTTTGAAAAGGSDSTSAGLGIDTAEVKFGATEDLGGGMKVAVSMGLNNLARRATVGGVDSSFALTTPVGVMTYSLAEGSDFISRSVGQSGGQGMDGKVLSSLAPAGDGLSFDTMAGPVALGFDYGETADGTLGQGAEGTAAQTAQRQYQVRVGYNVGALKTTFRYAFYDSKSDAIDANNRVRLAAGYDFGVAYVGAAYSRLAYTVGTRTDTGVSVSVPLGALTVGANWASRQRDNAQGRAVADGTSNGYGLNASYALSKRTAVGLNYANWTANTATAAPSANKTSEASVLLSHSF
jgi:hypothetical protein